MDSECKLRERWSRESEKKRAPWTLSKPWSEVSKITDVLGAYEIGCAYPYIFVLDSSHLCVAQLEPARKVLVFTG